MDVRLLRQAPICGTGPSCATHGSLFRDHALSRRQFFRTAGGAVTMGVALSALQLPARAFAHGSHQPIPIPGGSPGIQQLAGGQLFHVYGPGPVGPDSIDPPDAEPATITDFNGVVGLAYLNGMVTRTNTTTGETRTLPFANSDMRFMKGIFRSADGQIHDGAFGFV